ETRRRTGPPTSSPASHRTRERPPRSAPAGTRSSSSPALASDLVPVGRVGRPHGIDGAFFVEGPSDRSELYAKGSELYVDGRPARVVASRRGGGNRPVIKL